MGQFDSYLQRGFRPPTIPMRVLGVLVVVGFTARAITRPSFESILTAALFLLVFTPDLIAPRRYRAWLATLDRRHPLLSTVAFPLVLVGCASFVLLREFLDRTPSALIAAALALIAVVAAIIGRRRRMSLSGRVD
ncbi:hypothetical protein ACFVWG_33345 [Kribbella sp. NPDC058245]|uniref:hypothetical protein n=1 Tax=Kribbella sp. NPDC058245 TaxID=3346399 RepID=UPI0036EDE059